MNGRSATVMTAVLSGLGWGALSFAVSVPVRAGLPVAPALHSSELPAYIRGFGRFSRGGLSVVGATL